MSRFAIKGETFELTDQWRCICGRTYDFLDKYAAAHWRETLVHRCGCGYMHSFRAGAVVAVKYEPAPPMRIK